MQIEKEGLILFVFATVVSVGNLKDFINML